MITDGLPETYCLITLGETTSTFKATYFKALFQTKLCIFHRVNKCINTTSQIWLVLGMSQRKVNCQWWVLRFKIFRDLKNKPVSTGYMYTLPQKKHNFNFRIFLVTLDQGQWPRVLFGPNFTDLHSSTKEKLRFFWGRVYIPSWHGPDCPSVVAIVGVGHDNPPVVDLLLSTGYVCIQLSIHNCVHQMSPLVPFAV